MKITTAIEDILKETLPNTINGIHIKYDLREVPSLVYHDQKDCILVLMPVEIECEDIAVSLRISPYAFPFDFSETSLAYKHLQKQVEEMLMTYIRNAKKWCDNRTSARKEFQMKTCDFVNHGKIPNWTPILCGDSPIGMTDGENTCDKPIKAVIFPNMLSACVIGESYRNKEIMITELFVDSIIDESDWAKSIKDIDKN